MARSNRKVATSRRSPSVGTSAAGPGKVSREEAEEAVRTLLRWAGDDPTREGLIDTPKRVVKAYADWFSGYNVDPREYMRRTFEEVEGYDELVVLRDIAFESYCEASHGAHYRSCPCGLPAVQQGRGDQQAGACGRWLRAAFSGAGKK